MRGLKNDILSNNPCIMGVVNVTPDSFSDGGDFYNENKAVEQGIALVHQGAQMIDVGGESTRPGAQVVEVDREIDRVVPVVETLSKEGIYVSIDTRNAKTMKYALRAGAKAVNDISALEYDSESVDVVKKAQVPIFMMHMQGQPQDMQEKPKYNNVVEEVFQYLQARISFCETNGIDKSKIITDVGIGFGKTLEHNLLLLSNIKVFHDLECKILLGTSRKTFIGQIDGASDPRERLGGSLSSVLWGRSQGVQFFRVHDVQETRQALAVYDAIADSSSVSMAS